MGNVVRSTFESWSISVYTTEFSGHRPRNLTKTAQHNNNKPSLATLFHAALLQEEKKTFSLSSFYFLLFLFDFVSFLFASSLPNGFVHLLLVEYVGVCVSVDAFSPRPYFNIGYNSRQRQIRRQKAGRNGRMGYITAGEPGRRGRDKGSRGGTAAGSTNTRHSTNTAKVYQVESEFAVRFPSSGGQQPEKKRRDRKSGPGLFCFLLLLSFYYDSLSSSSLAQWFFFPFLFL